MTILRCLGLLAIGSISAFHVASAAGTPPTASPNAAGNDKDAVRLIALPRTKEAASVDIWVPITRAKTPLAVLVLCPDRGQSPKALLLSPAWKNFAEDHSLGLAAVTLTTGPASAAKNAQPPSPMTQEALVAQALDHEFGAAIPLVIYGWPQQAALAEGLLSSSPKRVLGWCFRAPDHIPDACNAMPPGIVVCYKENKVAYDALIADFTRARKAAERLTWIAAPGEKPVAGDLPDLDDFVRNYFAQVLEPKKSPPQWESIDTKQSISLLDLDTHPQVASYLPSAALVPAWSGLHVPGGPAVAQQAVLEKEVDTFNPAQPKLHLYLRKPATTKAGSDKIQGVLAYCTWNGNRAGVLGRFEDDRFYITRYADEHQLALLTWETAGAFDNSRSADQRSDQENFEDNLSFDKLADAWERGVHDLCYETGLPDRDFLLYGISRGAQWAHRLALRKPGHFLAVHIHVNSSYDAPTLAAKNILWLQTTGEREYGYQSALRFYAKCRDMGYPIIFKAGENLGHSSSPQIEKLGMRFFDYALGIKAKRDAYAAQEGFSVGRKQAPPDLYAMSGLGQPVFYADFINQEVYQADQKDLIPEGQRVPLPTKELAQAWGEIVDPAAWTRVTNPTSTQAKTVKPAASATAQVSDGGVSTKKEPPKPGPSSGDQSPAQTPAPLSQPQPAQAGSVASSAAANQEHPSPGQANGTLPAGQNASQPAAGSPGFQREFQDSVRRANARYPDLAKSGSPFNTAFVNEYRRLKNANSPLLAKPTWPEEVARTLSAQPAQPQDSSPDRPARP